MRSVSISFLLSSPFVYYSTCAMTRHGKDSKEIRKKARSSQAPVNQMCKATHRENIPKVRISGALAFQCIQTQKHYHEISWNKIIVDSFPPSKQETPGKTCKILYIWQICLFLALISWIICQHLTWCCFLLSAQSFILGQNFWLIHYIAFRNCDIYFVMGYTCSYVMAIRYESYLK